MLIKGLLCPTEKKEMKLLCAEMLTLVTLMNHLPFNRKPWKVLT